MNTDLQEFILGLVLGKIWRSFGGFVNLLGLVSVLLT